jgi:dihydroorotate dehydrogenase (NAD+) catalytic subunit
MASLSGDVGGIWMDNPVMLAAGILGTTGASLKRAVLSGAGAVVTKSVGVAEREGHRGPAVVQVEGGLLNAMGLPNPSYRHFQEEIDIGRDGGAPVIASIFGSSPAEFVEVATGLEADGFELNLSCPHAERYGAEIGCEVFNVEVITRAVKESASVPVWVKLTPNVAEISALGLAAERGGADAIVAINTLRAMAIDVESCRPILGNRFGGLSGPAIKPVAVKCVYDLAGAVKIPVIGVGGVSSWEDACEMIIAGARGVQVGTALGNAEGYGIFRSISEGLSIYLDRKGMALQELVGAARRFP